MDAKEFVDGFNKRTEKENVDIFTELFSEELTKIEEAINPVKTSMAPFTYAALRCVADIVKELIDEKDDELAEDTYELMKVHCVSVISKEKLNIKR